MKFFLAALFLLAFSSLQAATISAGTYYFDGVRSREVIEWRCKQWKGWEKGKVRSEQTNVRQAYVIKDYGWTLYDEVGGLVKSGEISKGCAGLGSHFSNQYNSYSASLPVAADFPAACLDSENKMQTIVISRVVPEPHGSCDAGLIRNSSRDVFHYGYELDSNNQKIWNPQPIEFKSQ